MNRFFYTLLLRLFSPLLLAWMGLRARRVGGRWDILGAKRFGYYRGPTWQTQPVWIHAVSLGEIRAAQPLITALLQQGHTILLTHLTYTGRAEGERMFSQEIADGRLYQQWLPYDFPGACKRFIRHYQPAIAVMIEREVWPNLMYAASKARLPVVLASARFSDRSLRQSLRIGSMMRVAYSRFTEIYAQTLHDAQRLEQAGGHAVRVSGNFKFDVQLSEPQVKRGRGFAQEVGRRVVLVASTREGEDEMFIPELTRQIRKEQQMDLDPTQRTLFYLIPRHPQRFESAYNLLNAQGLTICRRTDLLEAGDGCSSAVAMCRSADIVLGDSLGEMPWYYAQAQVAIVAGSFAPLGGQNFIEACALGVPVIVGPHTRNFEQAVADAITEGAALRATHAAAAVKQAMELLEDRHKLENMADAGLHWVQQHKGSVQRVMGGINEILQRQRR